MINYFLTSFFIHAGLLLLLAYRSGAPGAKSGSVEVTIVNRAQAPILPKPDKSKTAIPGPGVGRPTQNTPVIPLKDYADHLKAAVDPVWVAKIKRLNLPSTLFLSTEVLLFPNNNGILISIKITKSSGNRAFDKLVLDTLNEVKQIPKPPDILVREGIIWEFSAGERS